MSLARPLLAIMAITTVVIAIIFNNPLIGLGGEFCALFGLLSAPHKAKKELVDYERINRLEKELELGLSDYRSHGVDPAQFYEQYANETDRLIARLDRQLAPPEVQLEHQILSLMSIPTHSIHPLDSPYPRGQRSLSGTAPPIEE